MLFWGNFTNEEADRYHFLQVLIAPWIAWASLSKTKKADPTIIEPYKPSDAELLEVEFLAMKGWGMLTDEKFNALVSALSPKLSTVMEI